MCQIYNNLLKQQQSLFRHCLDTIYRRTIHFFPIKFQFICIRHCIYKDYIKKYWPLLNWLTRGSLQRGGYGGQGAMASPCGTKRKTHPIQCSNIATLPYNGLTVDTAAGGWQAEM